MTSAAALHAEAIAHPLPPPLTGSPYIQIGHGNETEAGVD